jgi:hypothetical protein
MRAGPKALRRVTTSATRRPRLNQRAQVVPATHGSDGQAANPRRHQGTAWLS